MFKSIARVAESRSISSMMRRHNHSLPALPYAYDALEPAISEQIMRVHHTKHHQLYVNNLNAAEEKLMGAVDASDVKSAIALQAAIKFNGGGHLNHSLFWENLAPAKSGGGRVPDASSDAAFHDAIVAEFGSVDGLKKQFNAAMAGIQGSGWGWLVKDASNGRLKITTTANQDPVTGDAVILGIDAWEHAYYLQYENVKAKYFEAIWSVIDWSRASKRFSA